MSEVTTNYKRKLFTEVDSSHLDELSCDLWRRASIDVSTTVFPSPPAVFLTSTSSESTKSPTPPQSPPISDVCSLHMDMTYDDRIFYGIHNFEKLKYTVEETQCNIDFAASSNKVSITGKAKNVQKMAETFIANSTITICIQYRLFESKYTEQMRYAFVQFHRICEREHKVFTTYTELNGLFTFTFITFRNNGLGILQAINHLETSLQELKAGWFLNNVVSNLLIPANRRDLTGRGNCFIEAIERSTGTTLEVSKFEDVKYQFESIKITGSTLMSVLQARSELVSRFSYELIFTIFITNSRPLVEYISQLTDEMKSVAVSIERSADGPNHKTVTISGSEKCISTLFILRKQILNQVYKFNKSAVNM
ncbi:hypothetical protein TYRP_019645 [Tyrophagus putrescentiae]|nr:hypothetical protein TYRP_019645 [Tyrophagus putrescentiae]